MVVQNFRKMYDSEVKLQSSSVVYIVVYNIRIKPSRREVFVQELCEIGKVALEKKECPGGITTWASLPATTINRTCMANTFHSFNQSFTSPGTEFIILYKEVRLNAF